jgi:hypothetical protein
MSIVNYRGLQWSIILVENGLTHLERIGATSHKIALKSQDVKRLLGLELTRAMIGLDNSRTISEIIQDTNLIEREEKEAKNDENSPL